MRKNFFFKTCIDVSEPVEFINYMTMRLVAKDGKALRYFSSEKDPLYPEISSKGAVLLKNIVTKMNDERYYSNGIIEDAAGYYKIKLGFNIINESSFKLRSVMAGEKYPVDNEGIRKEIQRGEYLAIYKIKDENLVQQLKKAYPTLYKVAFEKGDMYTKFKPHNDHVKEEEYNISDDLEAIFFISENELIFTSLEEKTYKVGFKVLEKLGGLDLINEFIFPEPVIYDYAESKEKKFVDFLDMR